MSKVKLFTGGSGLLGGEMQKLFPDDLFPPSYDFNVENYEMMLAYLSQHKIKVSNIIHMAAFTSPPKIKKDPTRALDVNIVGTANIVRLCEKLKCRMVYISTDYVFDGESGNYNENDAVNPINKYAWSKLGGECAVKLYDNSVIIRLSFGSNEFPYPGAFTDQWTSREKVSDIARKVAKIVDDTFTGTIHVGSLRRSVYEYATSISPYKEIEQLSIRDMNVAMPSDTSLDTGLYTVRYGDEK